MKVFLYCILSFLIMIGCSRKVGFEQSSVSAKSTGGLGDLLGDISSLDANGDGQIADDIANAGGGDSIGLCDPASANADNPTDSDLCLTVCHDGTDTQIPLDDIKNGVPLDDYANDSVGTCTSDDNGDDTAVDDNAPADADDAVSADDDSISTDDDDAVSADDDSVSTDDDAVSADDDALSVDDSVSADD